MTLWKRRRACRARLQRREVPHHLVLKRDSIDFMNDELPAGVVDCVFTDPPYDGMNAHLSYGKARSANTSTYVWYQPLTNDRYPLFLQACKRALKDQAFFFCMLDNFSMLELGPQVGTVFDTKSILIWDKTSIGPGYYFRRQHELIIFATTGKRKMVSKGHADIIPVPRVRGKEKYPTEKPVALVRYCLEAALGAVGDHPTAVVMDPFGGSGSTAEAADELGHNSIYLDVADEALDRVKRRLSARGATVHEKLDSFLAAVQ